MSCSRLFRLLLLSACWLLLAAPGLILAKGDGYQNQPFTCLSGNCVTGQGEAQWADGARYEGGFVKGQRQGKGSMAWPGGDRYSGDWVAGLQQGHGTMTWSGGARYVGEWVEGGRTGQGSMIYSSGKRVDGVFQDGRLMQATRVIQPKAPAETGPQVADRESGQHVPDTQGSSVGGSQPSVTQGTSQPAPTHSTPAATPTHAGAQAAALLEEVSYQGRVQFVNLYLGGSLAELRQKAQAVQLPQGFTSREAMHYEGPSAWVAQYATYAESPNQAFCYGAALGCPNREQCEAAARQAWSQAGCLSLNSSEGYSAYDNGEPQQLHPDTFPDVRFFR